MRTIRSLLLASLLFALGAGSAGAQPDWQNPDVIQRNKLSAHATLMPYDHVASVLTGDRSASPYYKLLSGRWRFQWTRHPDQAPADFYEPSYDVSDWDRIRVPAPWQTQGYGTTLYTNFNWAFKYDPPRTVSPTLGNETGSYRRMFTVPSDWEGRRIVVHFDGVKSAFQLWVNGERVGYSQGGSTPAEFDLTPYLQKGENGLAVRVYRWSDGSYLENCDHWRMSGIFRDVYLFSTPQVHMRDFELRGDLTNNYQDGVLTTTVWVKNYGDTVVNDHTVELRLYNEQEEQVFSPLQESVPTLEAGEETTLTFRREVSNPKKWTAETPHLYTAMLSLMSGNGRAIEREGDKMGFRTVERQGNQILVNGKPIFIKGINRFEHDPKTERTISCDLTEKDVSMMKRFNINAVRMPCYPHRPAFYDMADEYGLYLMDEAEVETHFRGPFHKDPAWKKAHLDRMRRVVERDKNHPSVIMWSLGNENKKGPNLDSMSVWVRERDPSRIVYYDNVTDSSNLHTDILTSTYESPSSLREKANDQMPVIMKEFAHSQGNASGNLPEIWAVVENPEHPSLQGGFIFDWVDQSILVEKGKDTYFTYGGKGFGLTRDANFQSCGLVNPDRTPHPGLWEVKKVYQNVDVEPVDLSEGRIRIHNEHFFKDLSEYTLQWAIEANGDSIASGTIANVNVPARSSDEAVLGYDLPSQKSGTEDFLTVRAVLSNSTRWAPAGYEVAFDQFRLPSSTVRSPLDVDLSDQPSLSVEQSPKTITVTGADFEVVFDRLQGTLSSFVHGGHELVARGPIFNVWRPITDNDQSGWGIGDHYTSKWYDARLPDLAHRVTGVTAEKVTPRHVRVVIHAEMTEPGNAIPVFEVSYYYNVLANGEIVLGHTARPTYDFEGVGLPRLGLQMEVPSTQQRLTWFGRGPYETYRDRNTGARIDQYQMQVADQYFPYVRPQATGNKTGVRWAVLTNGQGVGLQVMPGPASLDSESEISVFPDTTSLSNLMGGPFEVSALPYTTENIDKALYNDKLVTHENVVLNIDRLQAGAGNMPKFRLPEYEVPPKPVQYVVVFHPLESEVGSTTE